MFRSALNASAPANEYNAYDRDIAVVKFFFDTSFIPDLRRSARITSIDFLSQIGGIFGLCLGCSLISGIEFVYWIFVKIFYSTLKEKIGASNATTNLRWRKKGTAIGAAATHGANVKREAADQRKKKKKILSQLSGIPEGLNA